MRKWWYIALSVLLLAPVYWQPQLQAGDLSRHIYNAWLVQLIETGRTQGLAVVSQTTNILFDLMLSGLFRLFGAEVAQRISVSVAVLVFVWGAFRFVSVVGGRLAWHLLPCIAMLAYGWVFHMGFFNFYLSMGLCFWALAAAWNWHPRSVAIAVPILALAYLAHALPVVWTVGLLLYQGLARTMSPRLRVYVTAGWLLVMMLIQNAMGHTMLARWSPQKVKMVTGADHVWVFDGKYYFVLVGLLIVWAVMFMDLLKDRGSRWVASSVPFQFCVISAAAVVVLPSAMLLPGFRHALVYIAERMSLGVAICLCALLAGARPRAFPRYAMALVAVVFFGFLFRDERILNALEDPMDSVISQIPAGQRIVGGIDHPDLQVFAMTRAVTHTMDRACPDLHLLGRCFSYASYETSTAAFRIRAVADHPCVTARSLQPLTLDQGGRMTVRNLKAGTPCGSTSLKALPGLFPLS